MLIIKTTKCDAIKIESNKSNYKIIEGLVKKNSCNGSRDIHHSLKTSLKLKDRQN